MIGRTLAVLLTVAVLATGLWLYISGQKSGVLGGDPLPVAEQLYNSRRFAEAEELLVKIIASDPNSANQAAAMAASCARSLGQSERALRYLDNLSLTNPIEQADVDFLRADILLVDLARIGPAIDAYRSATEANPEFIDAHERLARLLATCGLRDEAVPHVLKVLQQKESDLLMLLSRESSLIIDRDLLERVSTANQSEPYANHGLACHHVQSERLDVAADLFHETTVDHPEFAPSWAMLGYVLARSGRMDELHDWLASIPREVDGYAAGWIAKGWIYSEAGSNETAIRCYLEALRIRPDSIESATNLVRLLAATEHTEEAEQAESYVKGMHRLRELQIQAFFSGEPPTANTLFDLVDAFCEVGRVVEATLFADVALDIASNDRRFPVMVAKLRSLPRATSSNLVHPELSIASKIDASRYPLPSDESFPDISATMGTQRRPVAPIAFHDDAGSSGIDFRFDNSANGSSPILMHQFSGGGVGVIDFDCDRRPDLFFPQAGPLVDSDILAATTKQTSPDQLYRNSLAGRFQFVGANAGITDAEFGQGISVGDINSDGFPDVYLANIGPNRLLLNNGDGTFSTALLPPTTAQWTASAVVVDVTGDGIPEIYDVNYVTGADVLTKVCKHPDGSDSICMPYHFEPAPDRLLINNGDGEFSDVTTNLPTHTEPKYGLGCVSWSSHPDGSTRLFVSNDTVANNLLVFEDRGQQISDIGPFAGIAFNSFGKPEGCMGIAARDINADGLPDLHVTNFLEESNTLYVSQSEHTFVDQTANHGLKDATWKLLGFGTQFLDSNLDGIDELFVANGHIQDLERFGKQYRMLPNLFSCQTDKWNDVAATAGPYFSERRLGRAAAVVDWNLDRAPDLVVTHLETPAALLTSTAKPAGKALVIRLIGVDSPRDGTGAIVTALIDGAPVTRHVFAGGGYMAENEKLVSFASPKAEAVDELTIRWPAGGEQSFRNVRLDQTITVVETHEESYFVDQ